MRAAVSRPFYIARFLMEIGDLAIILPICRCTCKGTFTIYQPIRAHRTRRYTFMAFFNSAVTVLQTLVIALGRNGKIFYTSITSLSHISKVSGHEAADGWRRRGTDRYDSGAAAFRSVRLSKSCRSEDSGRAAKAACYIVRCRQSPQLAIFCALWQVHMLEVWRRTAV
jgi:hypothetical protein